MFIVYIITFDRGIDKECDKGFSKVNTVIDNGNVWQTIMKGDKEIDKEKWYVANNETGMWYEGTGKVTTHVIAPSHFTTTKSIYNKSQKCAFLW